MATTTTTIPATNSKSSVCGQNMNEVQKVFRRFDTNGDGKITSEDLGRVLKALGQNISDYEASLVMREIDVDNDGCINLEEFASFCKGHSLSGMGDEADNGELRDAFELYDHDHDGFISATDLHHILTLVGVGCSVQDCANMIRTVDADGDGSLSFEEFKEMMSNTNENLEAQLTPDTWSGAIEETCFNWDFGMSLQETDDIYNVFPYELVPGSPNPSYNSQKSYDVFHLWSF